MADAYESEQIAAQYLMLHYGTGEELLPYPFGPKESLSFPVRSVRDLMALDALPRNARALDIGCAVGRSTFELTRHCINVVGIDASRKFISLAETLKAQGRLSYAMVEEGYRQQTITAYLPTDVVASRAYFVRADAEALPFIGPFDVIHLANLLCRLERPKALLLQLAELVVPGGQLLITTPCTWLESFTPPEEWLGGSPQAPEQTTLGSLQELLGNDFRLDYTEDMPLLIRETERKYQWIVSEGSRWIRS